MDGIHRMGFWKTLGYIWLGLSAGVQLLTMLCMITLVDVDIPFIKL